MTNRTYDETNQASNETIEHEKLLNQTVSLFFNIYLSGIHAIKIIILVEIIEQICRGPLKASIIIYYLI